MPYADYSFYTVNGQTFALAAIGSDDVDDFGSKIGEVDIPSIQQILVEQRVEVTQ